MSNSKIETSSTASLLQVLSDPAAYPHSVTGKVIVHETHISWVFLAGDFAYKVKKPITTSFLDYGTLAERHRLCQEELRLGRRYAAGLYLDIVPIAMVDGHHRVNGDGPPIEYAVKMRRFPEDALLSQRLSEGRVSYEEVRDLAITVANFHRNADPVPSDSVCGSSEIIHQTAVENFDALQAVQPTENRDMLSQVEHWTINFFIKNEVLFRNRALNGFVRECHGDLHLSNVVYWNNRWIPFDGIEFNDHFRWIDVLSDVGFLAMDFAAQGRSDLGHSFINAYLEQTGDYSSLLLLRWYIVYRAMVRAKVAAMRSGQPELSPAEGRAQRKECSDHILLAHRFTRPERLCCWITHGLSGSGKSTGSEVLVLRSGAIRLRSDVERKRLFGMLHKQRPSLEDQKQLYSESTTSATYERLVNLARDVLQAGYSVVVDATFLKKHHRDRFQSLAKSEGVSFAILDFHADEVTLRQRVIDRCALGTDASDADIKILEHQMAAQDPLTNDELEFGFEIDASGLLTKASLPRNLKPTE